MTRANIVLLAALGTVFVWSAIHPHDYFTWILETFPAIIGFFLLVATYRRFPLTPLAYTLLMIHAAILMIGGHYTYAEVPLGFWMRDFLHTARNDYDRIGHFAQGFVPAMIAREMFIRLNVLNRNRWRPFLIVSICLAISATYEFIEWWSALIGGAASTEFLGTQGDVWDTQEDMFMCLIGAISALAFMRPWQDRQLAKQK